jgi:hypothetical protein
MQLLEKYIDSVVHPSLMGISEFVQFQGIQYETDIATSKSMDTLLRRVVGLVQLEEVEHVYFEADCLPDHHLLWR